MKKLQLWFQWLTEPIRSSRDMAKLMCDMLTMPVGTMFEPPKRHQSATKLLRWHINYGQLDPEARHHLISLQMFINCWPGWEARGLLDALASLERIELAPRYQGWYEGAEDDFSQQISQVV